MHTEHTGEGTPNVEFSVVAAETALPLRGTPGSQAQL